MSRYKGLSEAYGIWRKKHIDNLRECQFFLGRFAEQFRAYIEAPDFYEDYQAGIDKPKKMPYVQALEASYDAAGELKLTPAGRGKVLPDLIRSPDDRWLAGVSIVVEMDANTYPKARCNFPLWLMIVDGTCKLKIGGELGKEFTFAVADPTGPHAAFDFMLGWLHEAYAMNPGDKPREEKKTSIGFLTN